MKIREVQCAPVVEVQRDFDIEQLPPSCRNVELERSGQVPVREARSPRGLGSAQYFTVVATA
jgi:hypothetical protein